VAREHHRNRAFVGQPQRDRRADARCAAGHDHDLVLQIQIHFASPSFVSFVSSISSRDVVRRRAASTLRQPRNRYCSSESGFISIEKPGAVGGM
jgi:hypothetical protein